MQNDSQPIKSHHKNNLRSAWKLQLAKVINSAEV